MPDPTPRSCRHHWLVASLPTPRPHHRAPSHEGQEDKVYPARCRTCHATRSFPALLYWSDFNDSVPALFLHRVPRDASADPSASALTAHALTPDERPPDERQPEECAPDDLTGDDLASDELITPMELTTDDLMRDDPLRIDLTPSELTPEGLTAWAEALSVRRRAG